MILLLSGEGPTDIGVCLKPIGECEGADFKPGAMAWVVDKLVEPIWGYSPLSTKSCVFVSEHSLGHYCRSGRVGTILPGKKRPAETGYFFKNARGLAQMAKARAAQDKCNVGAVLFRDSDGTVASQRSLWHDQVKSIEQGFAAETFSFGVAMVPKPKSEAWLLCALQPVPYQNCARYEDLSGNDASPKSAKDALKNTLMTKKKEYENVPKMIEQGTIDPQRIQMPSFDRFRRRLQEVATKMQS